jgi:hypothetical protein
MSHDQSWHFYDLTTGIFIGRSFSGHEAALPVNTPPGCAAMCDVPDWQSQRVEQGELVACIPPQPTGAHLWNADMKRWTLNGEICALPSRPHHLNAMGAIESQ